MIRRVNKTSGALTLLELLVVLLIIVILISLLLPLLARSRMNLRRQRCEENLKTVGQAIAAYREDNADYFPFSWGTPDVPEPRRKDAPASLGCLYPGYIPDANRFHCPSTENEPRFQLHVSESQGHEGPRRHSANWSLLDSSYGYDCRVSPRAAGDHPVMADMDGAYALCRNTSTQNHEEGQNVLFVDGSVTWQETNYCSNDPNDNIFCEDPWHADTDSFVSDNTSPAHPSSDTADQWDDLSLSYDGYPDLHPGTQYPQ